MTKRPRLGRSLNQRFKAKRKSRSVYPNVACDDHDDRPGYAVCPHVFQGAAVAFSEPPRENLGVLVCATCLDTNITTEWRLCCDLCAVEKGHIRTASSA